MDTHTIYLGLGSNLGDKEKNIKVALQQLDIRVGKIEQCSGLYETSPEGFYSENNFLNTVCLLQSTLSPIEILDVTQIIERELGRRNKSVHQNYSDRTIDIDILLYDDQIIEYPHLLIPHPHMHKRSFVLTPLAEIAPNYFHPILKKTIQELKEQPLSQ